MADIPIPPIPPRRAPLIDIMRELEARPRQRQSQEFDPVAAIAAESRRSASSQPLPLPTTPPAVAPPPPAGDRAGAGALPAETMAAVYPGIRDKLPQNNQWVAAATRIAEKYDLPRDVFLSLVQRESNFDPTATSRRGAVGLTQLMPGTARDLGVDPRDPMANLDAGARYLRQQINRFGSLPLALAAYNAGPQRVIDAGREVPRIKETVHYVDRILRNAGMEGYQHPGYDPEKGYADGGLAALDQKYAEGGRVRRPAAAPVASPFDADYIERLAAQAVGAGEPERNPRDVTLLDRVGRGIGEVYREFVETPERLSQQVYDDAIKRGVDPESAARRADRIARRAALTTGAVEMAVPQTPADLALVAAGPLGRVAPAAGRAALGAAGVMMGMEPSEAEAGIREGATRVGRNIARRVSDVIERPLVAIHNTSPEKLERMGAKGDVAVAPSIAVTRADQPYDPFGSISLVAPASTVNPSRTPVYARDAYTPRYPRSETRTVRGEEREVLPVMNENTGEWRYIPNTPENALRLMKREPWRGGEDWVTDNWLLGQLTPQFKTMTELKGARGRIVPPSDKTAENWANELENLRVEWANAANASGRRIDFGFYDNLQRNLAEAMRRGESGMERINREYYGGSIPSDLLDRTRDFLKTGRDLPATYFEAKPRRLVPLSEFEGAVIPADTPDEIRKILERNYIKDVLEYSSPQERTEQVGRLRNLFFSGAPLTAGSLAALDEKYAEGGRVRRPAAAPVASPFDAGYIERLAAQAVGAGEPVTEVRSSEGRGFAPMPRSFGEAGQRMSAVIRGDVEPTPEEERQMNVVRGFTEGPASIRAYHASPHSFEQFKPSEFRRASFFASTPERARIGAGSGASEMVMETSTKLPRQNLNIYEVDIDPSKIRGLHYTPEEIEWFNSLPVRIKGDEEFERLWRSKPRVIDVRDWEDIYTPTQIGPREYIYSRKDVPPTLSYEDAISRNRDVYGGQHSHYNLGADEKAAAEIAHQRGMGGYLINDEAGLSIGVIDPNIVNITRRYAEGGLADLDEKYAEGGTVRAPKETTIAGQDHKLAYITDREAALLKARGGSGRMTDYGVRAYDEGDGPGGGDSDSSNSNSEAGTQDAADGNAGQGAGPTGAGAGAGPSGPGPSDSETGVSGSEDTAPDTETETATTAPTTAPTPTTGPFGQAPNSIGLGAIGSIAGFGLGVPGLGTIGSVIGSVMDAANLNAQLGMMGLNQSVSPTTSAVNAATMGMIGQSAVDQFGQALGFDALAEAPMSAFSTPSPGPSAPSDMGGGEYGEYGQTQYGTSDLANIATATAGGAPPLVDWNQIQREANAMNMSVSDYLATKWRSPAGMARGGMASLEQMHAKYAEGGEVYPPAGEIAEYDPDEIDRIARQIHLRLPEDERQDVVYEEAASPSDLSMRARMLMRGQNIGMPEAISAGAGNDRFSSSTSLRDMPIEDDRYGVSQRTLNTSIDAVLDAERKARIGAGMLALERGGEKGFTGYGPQVSAGYGPLSVHGGYQSITPNMPGAKSQGSYVYGGNLNIPIDDGGTEANIGATVMSGRRRQDGTQITGSLERPFLGGRLGLDVSADPSLRNKEILLGYRRAF